MTDRRNLVLGVVVGMSGLAALSQAAEAQAAVSDEEAQGALDIFLEAVFSDDAAKVEHVLAPEFQILRANGKSNDKASYLQALPKHKVPPATNALKVTSYGGIFVATYAIEAEQTVGGQPVEAVAPRLSVFRKEEGPMADRGARQLRADRLTQSGEET
jgi:hypothetical protein